MESFLKRIWKWVVSGATFASILGVVLFFLNDTCATRVALVFVCGLMLIVGGYSIYILHSVLGKHYPKEYDMIASFAEFKSEDGVLSSYDTFRVIQCKRTFLDKVRYNFKWSGTKLPQVTSAYQTVTPIVSPHNPQEWDYVDLVLKKPLVYNECAVLHFHTDNDNSDKKAGPYICLKVDTPIPFIHFRALLAYKDSSYRKPARFERKRYNSNVDTDWEVIQSVEFDVDYKIYTCMQEHPNPGYYYRLKWE